MIFTTPITALATSLLVLSSAASASPLFSWPRPTTTTSSAQPTSTPSPITYSRTWNDIRLEPIDFGLRSLGGCAYQYVFKRDMVDSSYNYDFFATYGADPALVRILPIVNNTNLALGRAASSGTIRPYVNFTTSYCVNPVHFANLCNGAGAQPAAVIARTSLEGYRFRNDWISAPTPPTNDVVPGVPGNVRATTKGVSPRTVSWDAVAGATGYYVLSEIPVFASELGRDVPGYITTVTDANNRTSGIRPNAYRVAIVARGPVGDSVSDATKVISHAI